MLNYSVFEKASFKSCNPHFSNRKHINKSTTLKRNNMKHLLTLVAVSAIATSAFSQSQNWWKVDGNSNGSSSTFLGTTTAQPLIFKTNNITRAIFSSTGAFQVNSLVGTGNRILQTDANGNILPLAMGNANEVLYGNGIWGTLPNIPTLFWQQHNTDLYYMNGNVGIGTNTPLVSLDVIGDARVSNNLYVGGGVIITEKVNANSEVLTGKMRADSIMLDSTRAVYGYSIFKDKVKLENKLQVVGDALVNGNLTANTINTANFNISNTLTANKITAYRITATPGDSLIRFGDSTIFFQPSLNRIFASPSSPTTSVKGLALGTFSIAQGNQSFAIGYNVRTLAGGINSVVLGGTIMSGVSALRLNQPNTLWAGFNSDIPTFVITSANGNGTTGNIGIGTTAPEDKFQIGNNLNKIVFGSAGGSNLGWGSYYIGFNTSRQNNSTWSTGTDGANNGGAIIYSNVSGDILFSTIPASGNFAQIGIPDATIFDNTRLFISKDGEVGINTKNTSGYRLAVNGGIRAKYIKVNSNWADYVFKETYTLIPLFELENYININGHLPNIPSEEEIVKNGLDVSEALKLHMEKIEELTLYVIELKKEIESLKK